MDTCAICETSLDEGHTVCLREKGSDGINRASEARPGCTLRTKAGDKVHKACREKFINPKYNASVKQQASTSSGLCSLRSKIPSFDFKEHCLFCGTPCKYDGKKRDHEVIIVKTNVIDKTLSVICLQRNDEWGQNVKGRLEYANDLHAEDAVYHHSCSTNFRTGKQIPVKYNVDEQKS